MDILNAKWNISIKKCLTRLSWRLTLQLKCLDSSVGDLFFFSPPPPPPLATVPRKVMTVTVDNPVNAKVQISKKHHLSLIMLTLKEGLSSFYNGNKLRGITQQFFPTINHPVIINWLVSNSWVSCSSRVLGLGAKVSAPYISRWRITIPFVARSELCYTKRKR